MSQFPINTKQGVYEAINYLASGPSGLGQDFAGFSSYQPAYLTGNFRLPFSQSTPAKLYVAPISCSTAEQIDPNTFKYTFSSAQATPPFQQGQPIIGDGWSNDFFNGSWAPIGVADCTTTYVIVRTSNSYTGITTDTGGTVYFSVTGKLESTDCNARVVVNSGTDRVFISAQLVDTISYSGSGDLTYRVQVNRYIGFLNNDPTNPDYLFNLDATVAERTYSRPGLSGTGTLTEIETVFSTVIDTPAPGYYWYILEVEFDTTDTLEITQAEFGLRSLSSQVVKQ